MLYEFLCGRKNLSGAKILLANILQVVESKEERVETFKQEKSKSSLTEVVGITLMMKMWQSARRMSRT